MSQYLDAATARLHASDEFTDPTFTYPGTDRDEHEGWYNEATFLFHTYFMQEEKLQYALRALINKQGKINIKQAISLFKSCGIRIDARISNPSDKYVSAHEIVEDFLKTQQIEDRLNVKKS